MGDLMRLKSLATWTLVALGAVVLALSPAEAASRRDQTAQHRPAERHAGARPAGQVRLAANTHARTTPAPVASGRAAPRHAARATARGRGQLAAPVRGQLAVTRDRHAAVSNAQACRSNTGRRTRCGGPAMSWTRGLAPAAGVQANECPDGTMATPARGHENIVRCMPI